MKFVVLVAIFFFSSVSSTFAQGPADSGVERATVNTSDNKIEPLNITSIAGKPKKP